VVGEPQCGELLTIAVADGGATPPVRERRCLHARTLSLKLIDLAQVVLTALLKSAGADGDWRAAGFEALIPPTRSRTTNIPAR
jgi:hypothetical protein